MRVAIVHHWFLSVAGGERVVDALASLFPDADIFTLFCDPESLPPATKHRRINKSFLNSLPGSRRFHRQLLPLYPIAVETLDLQGYDLVISSDSGPVKGVITEPGALHICYCHSPMRYIWDAHLSYARQMSWPARLAFHLSAHYVRNWDYSAAQRVDYFIANSRYVAGRIRKYYGRDSIVVYPPIETGTGFVEAPPGDYYLSVGRLIPYKRTDLIVKACSALGRKLIVVGEGPEKARLRRMAGSTVEFLNAVDDAHLWELYARCRALLFAADEDFGMVPLEAQSFGKPVVAYGKGGSLETVRGVPVPVDRSLFPTEDFPTGVFFSQQTVDSLTVAIRKFEDVADLFSPDAIRKHASRFDSAVFSEQIKEFIALCLAAHEERKRSAENDRPNAEVLTPRAQHSSSSLRV